MLLLTREEYHWTKYLTDNFRKMATVKVTQIKSAINRPKRQKLTVQALGLGKLHRTVEHNATPQILGMIKKVQHLVRVEK